MLTEVKGVSSIWLLLYESSTFTQDEKNVLLKEFLETASEDKIREEVFING